MKLSKQNFCTVINGLQVLAGITKRDVIEPKLLSKDNTCLLLIDKDNGAAAIDAFIYSLEVMTISYTIEPENYSNTFRCIYLNH